MLHKHNNSYAQLSTKIAKLEKSNKKLKRANKKRKHDHNSDSNNSNSSRSDGSGSPVKLVINCTKRNKTNTHVNTYPRPNKATEKVDSNLNSVLINENIQVLWSDKDLKNLKNHNTLHKLENKNLVAKACKDTQSERTADTSAPELSGAFLNSVSSSFSNEQEGRVTAVVAKARYQRATENQTKQKLEHSARSRPSNAVIKVLLDSGSDGNLMFHEKGTPMQRQKQ
jgi:hypothetical protein